MSLDTDKGQELSAKQNDLVDAHTGMPQYTLDKRYSYIMWQNTVNIVMGKEVGPTLLLREERHSEQRLTWWQVWLQCTDSFPNQRAQYPVTTGYCPMYPV
eukprot:1591907-Ditylum_brightwellii.AAC.1